jgi:peptidoglycan lytic transglycosylase D
VRNRIALAGSLSAALTVNACGHHAAPRSAPTPEPAPVAVAPSTDSLTARADSTRPDTSVSHSAVTQQALKVFGDSVSHSIATAPDTETSPTDTVSGPTWDIDVRSYETQRRVEHFVAEFTGEARDHFGIWVQRGTRYEPMMREKLRAAGLPEDLVYLALIESGYSPHAYSRAAAVGMWQLMTSTARGAGLRVDWWVDERRDPVRSTDAAIRFLRYLKDQFGSLYLAAAAYNGGPGRISRGLTRYADDFAGTTGDDLFFALANKDYLRDETKDYVPQLIAAALVAKEPLRYGLHVEAQDQYIYDTVRVGPSTPLAAIAKAARTSAATIVDLNPYVLRGITPPKDSFTVRVPVGAADLFDSAFAALPASQRTGYVRAATTKRADTFGSIANRFGLTAHQLQWYNPGVHAARSGRIAPGSTIRVPSAVVVAAALDVPDPAIERYGVGGRRIHIVKRGETLGVVAVRYHTTVRVLMRLNGLRKSMILPGQALAVSGTRRPVRKRARHAA